MSRKKTVRNVFFTIFCLFACVSLGYAESCSSKGQVQYKYTASGCSYSTQTRTCCSNGSWSSWGGSCPTTPSPVSSTVSLKLDCTGTSYIYESFGNGMYENHYDPTYTIPYPKCPQSNICSGKSNGYVCYQSYTGADYQCTADVSCNYWTEDGTTDQSRECYWGGKASVTISIVTCK